jgi:3-oxoacyl-[acyl-carrier-protein] synthase III
MNVSILDIDYYLPEKIETNEDLAKQFPAWNLPAIEERCGVKKRHIANDQETSVDLAVKATQKLFTKKPQAKHHIDGVIFCTQTPDHIIPPNSCLFHHSLDLSENVLAFDINHACSGFTYGLGIAKGLILSGAASSILLINADTYSKYINKKDRSTRVLFGDGAAVSWIGKTPLDKAEGWKLMDINFGTYGHGFNKFFIPAGGCRSPKTEETSQIHKDQNGNERTKEDIHMDGMGILTFVKTKVVEQITQLCHRNKLNIEDVDLFVFHQASKLALETLQKILKIPSEKMVINLDKWGNTVSASIPIALNELQREGLLHPNQKIIISGFGAGLSASSAYLHS